MSEYHLHDDPPAPDPRLTLVGWLVCVAVSLAAWAAIGLAVLALIAAAGG